MGRASNQAALLRKRAHELETGVLSVSGGVIIICSAASAIEALQAELAALEADREALAGKVRDACAAKCLEVSREFNSRSACRGAAEECASEVRSLDLAPLLAETTGVTP